MFSNPTKVWIFILSCCLLFLLVGYKLGERTGLLIGLCFAVLVNVLVFFYGDHHILNILPARKAAGQDPWGVQPLIEDYAFRLGLKTAPRFYILEDSSPVAFCVGVTWRRPCLCLSEGLLRRFSKDELRAVVAHQISHLRRLDTFSFGVASILANTVTGLGQLLDLFWPPNFFLDRKQKPFLTLLAPVGWILIKSMVRGQAYYENDLITAELIGDRRRMAEVLWKLDGFSQTLPLQIPPCTSHLFIVNPEAYTQKNLFLRSHPSIETRLLKLLGYYPI